jgi:Universal stress protein family
MYGERIYDVLEEQSKQWPADLIVTGTHGRRGARHLMLGSVAEGLIRIATKPVLLIRGPEKSLEPATRVDADAAGAASIIASTTALSSSPSNKEEWFT